MLAYLFHFSPQFRSYFLVAFCYISTQLYFKCKSNDTGGPVWLFGCMPLYGAIWLVVHVAVVDKAGAEYLKERVTRGMAV